MNADWSVKDWLRPEIPLDGIVSSAAGPETNKTKTLLARVFTCVSCVVDVSREKKVQSAKASVWLKDCRKAVSLVVHVYDVIDTLKDFLKQISDSKKSNTQQCVIYLHLLSNTTFKLLDKKLYPEKSGFWGVYRHWPPFILHSSCERPHMESEWNCNQFRSRKCSESETSRHIRHSLIIVLKKNISVTSVIVIYSQCHCHFDTFIIHLFCPCCEKDWLHISLT